MNFVSGLDNLVDFVNDDSATNCGGLLADEDLPGVQTLPDLSKSETKKPEANGKKIIIFTCRKKKAEDGDLLSI